MDKTFGAARYYNITDERKKSIPYALHIVRVAMTTSTGRSIKNVAVVGTAHEHPNNVEWKKSLEI